LWLFGAHGDLPLAVCLGLARATPTGLLLAFLCLASASASAASSGGFPLAGIELPDWTFSTVS